MYQSFTHNQSINQWAEFSVRFWSGFSIWFFLQKGDILFIDNTLYNGEMGMWRAWLLDENGDKVECGIVPNRYKAEEEVLSLQQSNSDLMDNLDPHRRSARRSIFKRRKNSSGNHRRELASFSSSSLGYETFSVAPEEPLVPTYLKVSPLTTSQLHHLRFFPEFTATKPFETRADFPTRLWKEHWCV